MGVYINVGFSILHARDLPWIIFIPFHYLNAMNIGHYTFSGGVTTAQNFWNCTSRKINDLGSAVLIQRPLLNIFDQNTAKIAFWHCFWIPFRFFCDLRGAIISYLFSMGNYFRLGKIS